MNEILKKIEKIGIVPVVKLDDETKAVPLAKALIKGGLPVAEVTFRTSAAAGAIKSITAECPEMLVGAGTVLTIDQVDRAVAAGAKFIVTPGFNPRIVSYCIDKNIPITPGCPTSSDIEQALEFGLDVLKFFPAENLGGIKMIKALAAPYTTVKFMPTGGVNTENLNSYLSSDKILACGGSWMVKADLINSGKFDEIEKITHDAVMKMLGFKLDHIGINVKDSEKATRLAKLLKQLFGFESREIPVSYFCSDEIELMKDAGLGESGHIAIKTNNVDRAVYHLRLQGVKFREDSARLDKDGKITFIYLEDEIAGFAIHLC